MRIKLKLSYDGTNYCGWQVQPNGVTVQEKLEQAVFAVTGEKVRVTGSGRTDAGVHAEGQVAHFDTNTKTVKVEKFYRALNAHLPDDIRVYSSELANDDFDACRGAKQKTYNYNLYLSDVEKPLWERTAVMVDGAVEVEKMQEVAKIFLGEHDFKAFCASGSGAKTTIRTIYDISIKQDGQKITISVTGNGFLYNMVRIMVGSMLEVGQGRRTKEDVEKMLLSGERSLGGKTLPAKGLCLMSVEY